MVTGSPFENGRNTEIIDLEYPTFNCTKVPKFPIQLYFATGGLVNDTPIVCGGYKVTSNSKSKDCYKLNGAWHLDRLAKLSTVRSNAALGSAIWNNHLLVVGGYSSRYLHTMELVTPNARSKTLRMRLPLGLGLSCIVPWDSNTFMVIGGYSTKSSKSKETYFIDMINNRVTPGPSLINGRRYLGCQEMIVNGESFIVVAGGSGAKNLTEFLPKSNLKGGWEKGPDLPVSVSHHQLVASTDKTCLYTIGNTGSNGKDIYKLSCAGVISDCLWTKADVQLKYGRFSPVAMYVPEALVSKLCQ